MSILTIRKHKRFAMRQAARLLCDGSRPCVGLLFEVSLDGCRLAITDSDRFTLHQSVTVDIKGFAKLDGQIRWASNGSIGLRFDQPLHTAELDQLLHTCRPKHDAAAMIGLAT